MQTDPKRYDLEDRTFKFAKRVIAYVDKLQKTVSSIETGKQLVRSAGSIGANYIEANEALSKKDFVMRIKISRKEAKESNYWLRLTEVKEDGASEKDALVQEATELTKIFGAIVEKCK
ncbi:MAG: four helix bundle protein [Candidatus Omnitrophica bacterium]|nr:four helix bundle protein [Candidatus Omnitrophota bacterium]